jgi:pullulanase/glycogen debranching enzyme
VAEFKSMVKALHAAGLEVILDVVYNHTAEGIRTEWQISRYGAEVLEGDEGQLSDFAQRLNGSSDRLSGGRRRASIKVVPAHDGFTVRDLVSYNEKHNQGQWGKQSGRCQRQRVLELWGRRQNTGSCNPRSARQAAPEFPRNTHAFSGHCDAAQR